MAFIQPIKKRAIKFKNWEMKYQWNKNTENFELVKVNIQKEIDNYKGLDLKSMIAKNIMPTTDKKGVYVDTTIFKNITKDDILNNAFNEVERISENENISTNINENLGAVKKTNNETWNNNSQDKKGD